MTRAILLVGGVGSRLRPITNYIPKPMVPIAGLPVTEHQIMLAKRAGITEIVLATSYMAEVFEPYFGDGSDFGMKISYAVEQVPLGTGGAIRHAITAFQGLSGDEPIVIFNGDIISQHHVGRQLEFHRSNEADVTIYLTHVDDARAYGCVPTDGHGRVSAFLEKMENPVTNAINAGCYIFNSGVIESIAANTVISVEREVFPRLISEGARIYGYEESAYWIDIGTPAALLRASRDLVGKDVLALDHSTIDFSAILEGGTAIGRHCVIGAQSEIKASIICDGVTVGEGSIIENSFIAPGTVLSAGTQSDGLFISSTEKTPLGL